MKKVISGVKELIGKGDIEEVFRLLQESLNNRNSKKFDEFILLKSRFITLRDDKNKGVSSQKEVNLAKNQITENLLSFANTLTENDFQQSFKEIYRSSSQEINNLKKRLEEKKKIIKSLEIVNNDNHYIINSPLHRTKLITENLEKILNSQNIDHEKITIWSVSFLSIFAFSIEESESSLRFQLENALLKEQKVLLDLADVGVKIKCVITPASSYRLIKSGIPFAINRTKKLIKFLCSDFGGLRNIDWAVSEYDTENRYIIGDESMFVGYKKGSNISYGMTKFIDDDDVINMKVRFYEDFFSDLAANTLFKWGKKTNLKVDNNIDRNYLLREATINCLKKSLKYLESKK